MKTRIIGMTWDEISNSVIPIKMNMYECICTKHKEFTKSNFSLIMNQINYPESYNKGDKYEFYLDDDGSYVVYVNNTNYYNRLEEKVFNKHFVEITNYRDNLINDILN